MHVHYEVVVDKDVEVKKPDITNFIVHILYECIGLKSKKYIHQNTFTEIYYLIEYVTKHKLKFMVYDIKQCTNPICIILEDFLPFINEALTFIENYDLDDVTAVHDAICIINNIVYYDGKFEQQVDKTLEKLNK